MERKIQTSVRYDKDLSVCLATFLSACLCMYLSPHSIFVFYTLYKSVWGRSQTTEAGRNRLRFHDHHNCCFQVGHQEKHEAQETARGEGPHRFSQPDSKRAEDPGLSVTKWSCLFIFLYFMTCISCDISYCIHRSCMRSLSLRLTKTSP